MLRVWLVIDWRFHEREAQELVLLKGGPQTKILMKFKKLCAADQ